MINTNGIRFAHDPALMEAVAETSGIASRCTFNSTDLMIDINHHLRGEPLLEIKLKALENLGRARHPASRWSPRCNPI